MGQQVSYGGGHVSIHAGTLVVDGRITCDGSTATDSLAGGGAGGSIYLSVQNMSGNGSVSANGGNGGKFIYTTFGEGGGGGGGRIAIFASNGSEYNGAISAAGGLGFQVGSAGTVFTAIGGNGSTLVIANNDRGNCQGTRIDAVSPFGPVDKIIVRSFGAAILDVDHRRFLVSSISGDGTGVLYVSNDSTLVYDKKFGETLQLVNMSVILAGGYLDSPLVSIGAGGRLHLTSIGAQTAIANAVVYTFTNLTINALGSVVFDYRSVYSGSTNTSLVRLKVVEVLTINHGGLISSNGQGYSGLNSVTQDVRNCSNSVGQHGIGCGGFGTIGGGGGAYGGKGGQGLSADGGAPYGDVIRPTDFGSGGGGSFPSKAGGKGGGVVHIRAHRIEIDGTISANGVAGVAAGAGGGSGGTVNILAAMIFSPSGKGVIEANGGDGSLSATYFGGGGSGGRLSINCKECPMNGNSSDYTLGTSRITMAAYGGTSSISAFSDSHSDEPVWARRGMVASNVATREQASPGTIYTAVGNHSSPMESSLIVSGSPVSSIDTVYVLSKVWTHATTNSSVYLTRSRTDYISDVLLNITKLFITQNASFSLSSTSTLTLKTILVDDSSQLIIERGASLMIPERFFLSAGTVVVAGRVLGGTNLTLSGKSKILLGSNSSWTSSTLSTLSSASTSSGMNVSELSMLGSSELHVLNGETNQSRLVLTFNRLVLSYLSSISSNGNGGQPMQPKYGWDSVGFGGWHASSGGGTYFMDTQTYGSSVFPQSYGTAGGSTIDNQGGAGGGALYIVVGEELLLDGTISSDGSACVQKTAQTRPSGGGAGGSVLIQMPYSGKFSGDGTVSASGGSSCASGGFAGSGGRIAIHILNNSFSNFHGTFRTHPGTQYIATDNSAGGGTVFLSDEKMQNGMLTTSSNRESETPICMCGCSTVAETLEMSTIYISESPLIVDNSCSITLSDGVQSIRESFMLSTFTGGDGNYSGGLRLYRNSTMHYSGDVVMSNIMITLNSSIIVSNNSLTMRNSTLRMTTEYSRVLTVGKVLDLPDSFVRYSLSFVSVNALNILLGGLIEFLPVATLLLDSNHISADSLVVYTGGIIKAVGVQLNPHLSWNSTNLDYKFMPHFGRPSGTKSYASGGGHSGPGTQGSGHTSAGAYRGEVLLPTGPGGPGGPDLGKQILGGGGGGGIRITVSSYFLMNGTIDVSGSSAPTNTAAGGGAGGSIYIESAFGSLQGSGALVARGGNGSISGHSNLHSGAGSGGRVAINVCRDFFDGEIVAEGGLSVQLPASLSPLVSVTQFDKLLQYSSSKSLGLLQIVVAAASGTIVRVPVAYNSSRQYQLISQRGKCVSSYNRKNSFTNYSSITVSG